MGPVPRESAGASDGRRALGRRHTANIVHRTHANEWGGTTPHDVMDAGGAAIEHSALTPSFLVLLAVVNVARRQLALERENVL